MTGSVIDLTHNIMWMFSGLSTLAVCAPSDKFLNMGGPLAMGLGVVLVSSVGKTILFQHPYMQTISHLFKIYLT